MKVHSFVKKKTPSWLFFVWVFLKTIWAMGRKSVHWYDNFFTRFFSKKETQ
jgi:hypothetical protein